MNKDLIRKYKKEFKPDEPKFKIGDWVRDVSPENSGIFRITSQNQLEQAEEDSAFELWKPQPGEWCWFKSSICSNTIFGQYIEQIGKRHVSKRGHFKYCEPFIGTLPTFSQD